QLQNICGQQLLSEVQECLPYSPVRQFLIGLLLRNSSTCPTCPPCLFSSSLTCAS
ncbi:unnamed protein product, partial [Callosobruchus maculatus]